MFIAPAFAQTAAPAAGGDLFTAMVPMIAIVGIFYLLLIRPQQKKAKEHKVRLAAIRRGDRVVTGGGILGTVTKIVSESDLVVEIAEGVRVTVARATIADIIAKPEPAKPDPAKDGGKKAEAAKAPEPQETQS